MKIGNIELTKERMTIAAITGAAFVLLAAYLVFYAPALKKLRAGYSECRTCESHALDARNVINSAGKVYGERVLMTEKGVPYAIDELTKHGKAMDINFNSIRSKEMTIDKTSQYKILPIEMEIESKDEQFANFLGSLDELKKGLIKVRSFDIIPDKEDRTRLHANIVVDLYLSGRDYAE